MTYYHKCKNCAVYPASCERRQNIKASIRGLGLTSVKFACPDRLPLFHAGQRVEFDWSYWDDSARDIYGECDEDVLTFSGTVVCENESARRFVVRVDQGAVQSSVEPEVSYYPKDVFKNGGFAVKVRPQNMRTLSEQSKDICPDCLGYGVSERCQASEYVKPSCRAMCRGVTP